MIHIQRNSVLIIQTLEIGEIGDVIKHSSKVITTLTSLLLNYATLSFNLLQTLTLAYQPFNATQPGHFGDCWLSVPPGTSSQLSQLLQ